MMGRECANINCTEFLKTMEDEAKYRPPPTPWKPPKPPSRRPRSEKRRPSVSRLEPGADGCYLLPQSIGTKKNITFLTFFGYSTSRTGPSENDRHEILRQLFHAKLKPDPNAKPGRNNESEIQSYGPPSTQERKDSIS